MARRREDVIRVDDEVDDEVISIDEGMAADEE